MMLVPSLSLGTLESQGRGLSPRTSLTEKWREQQRGGTRPVTNPADGGLFKSDTLALNFQEPLPRAAFLERRILWNVPLTLPGRDASGDFGAVDRALRATLARGRRLPPDPRLPLRAASRRCRPAAFRGSAGAVPPGQAHLLSGFNKASSLPPRRRLLWESPQPADYLYPCVRHVCVTEPRPFVGAHRKRRGFDRASQ